MESPRPVPSQCASVGRAPAVGFLWHGSRNIGGGEYGTWLLARSLQPEFRSVLFYGNYNPLVEQYARDRIQIEQVVISPTLTNVYRDSVGANPIRWVAYVWHGLKAVVEVVRMIEQHQIRVLHPVDNLSKIIGGIAARLAGIKVIAHCRDELKRGGVERVLLWYQSVFMHRIIAVAGAIRDLLLKAGCRPDRVITIHNGVDVDVFDPARVQEAADIGGTTCQGRMVLAIVATFDRCKGHSYLFEACARLKQMGCANWICLVVGDGREREALERQVNDLGLTKEVVFLGYRRNVVEILKSVDLLVIPSEQEAFPRVALEAMAMEVPVVASAVGGLSEAVEHGRTGLIVPPCDVDALAGAIKAMSEDPEYRHAMGCQGRERVTKLFNLKENVARTKQIYREVLGVAG